MGLMDEIQAERQTGAPVCSWAKLLDQLDKADRADVDAAVADESITGAAIVRALRARGHKVTEKAVRRHRREECVYCGHR